MSEPSEIKRSSRPSSLKYKKQEAKSNLNPPPPNVRIESVNNKETFSESYTHPLEPTPSKPPANVNGLKANSLVVSKLKSSLSIERSGTDSGCASKNNSWSSLASPSCRTSGELTSASLNSPSNHVSDSSKTACTPSTLSPNTPQVRTPQVRALSRLKPASQSTDSLDSGWQSQASSRTSLCRTSQENTPLSLAQQISSAGSDGDCDSKSPSPECPVFENVLDSPTQPILVVEPNRRVSVDQKVLAELFQAALKLKGDIRPIEQLNVTDGPYTSRRRSTGDAHRMADKKGKMERKMSSQAYFHSLVDLPKSPTHQQRKTSGCIVCDRNRKDTSSSSTVIIKTSMSRRSPPTRRFSEALQVVRRSQSDIPYVELYVLKVEDLKKLQNENIQLIHKPLSKKRVLPIDENREGAIEEFITENLPEFVRYTNWTNILCHLVSKRLLSADERQKLQSLPTNTERGNFFYLDVLPTKGKNAYSQFYNCLKGEQEHIGHADLLDKIDKALLYM